MLKAVQIYYRLPRHQELFMMLFNSISISQAFSVSTLEEEPGKQFSIYHSSYLQSLVNKQYFTKCTVFGQTEVFHIGGGKKR